MLLSSTSSSSTSKLLLFFLLSPVVFSFHLPTSPIPYRGAVKPLKQVWSNPQETEDYLLFASGRAPKEQKDQPSVIIGKGKLANMWASLGKGDDVLLGRGEALPEELPGGYTSYPIYLAVPYPEVKDLVESLPRSKRADLVFMQVRWW